MFALSDFTESIKCIKYFTKSIKYFMERIKYFTESINYFTKFVSFFTDSVKSLEKSVTFLNKFFNLKFLLEKSKTRRIFKGTLSLVEYSSHGHALKPVFESG